MQYGDEIARILSSAKQRDETLSKVAKRHSTDTAELLTKLNEVLNAVFPNRLAIPLGFAEYIELLESKAGAAKALASPDGKVNWDYAMRLVSGELREDPLPDGIREGTHYADVYRGVNGVISRPELKSRFPDYSVDDIMRHLVKAGAFEKVGHGKWKKKVHRETSPEHTEKEEAGFQTEQSKALPSCLKEGTVLAKIWRAIDSGKTTTEALHNDFGRTLSYNLVMLQKKGVVERTGRGEYRAKHDGPQTGAITSRKVQVRSTLLTYLQEHASSEEVPYSVIIPEMEKLGLNKNSVYAELGLQKRKRAVTGTPGMAKYVGKEVANAPKPDIPATQSPQLIAATSAVVNTTPALLAEAPDVSSFYGILPQLNEELSKFETAVERLPKEQISRAYKLVLGMLGEKEAVTDAHANALQPLYEAFRKSDAEKLISHLESRGRMSPADMVKYVNEFTAVQKSPPPAPAAQKAQDNISPEKTLEMYSSLSGNMRDAVMKLKSVIAVSGSSGKRIERLVLGYLPENPETTTSSQQTAIASIASAFKKAVNGEVNVQDLLEYLEQKKSPENTTEYLARFFNSETLYWDGIVGRHGDLGQKLRSCLPFLTSSLALEHSARRYIGDNGSDAGRVYNVQQIAGFIHKARKELGADLPGEVYLCLSNMLKNGTSYLPTVVGMIGDKDRLPVTDCVKMLKEIRAKGDTVATRIIGQYTRT